MSDPPVGGVPLVRGLQSVDAAPASDRSPAVANSCRRCRKPLSGDEPEEVYLHVGLCFWCAYVEPQA